QTPGNSFKQNGIDSINAWAWISLFCLLGGLGLLIKGIISWHIPAAMMGTLFAISQGFNLYDPSLYPGGNFHLVYGGGVLAALFVATDPVTSPTTPSGKLFYGTIIGTLIYCIRTWGANPDGIAFAILIANGMTPMIDDHFRPPVISEPRKKSHMNGSH
ncbi:MAG: RnfABCDGE type electron transport complex subunit D, partial [Gammaproteobacteria bacterium]|nr:RnfABCDGE type electron transport complex subunit D [Gammaproteobacteria bacterium]